MANRAFTVVLAIILTISCYMGTLLNSSDTKYSMTLTGKVSAVNYGDESGRLLGFEIIDTKITSATLV